MPLRLDGVKRFFEGEMIDTVRIERPDAVGYENNVLNPITMQYESSSDLTSPAIYEGKALITPLQVFPNQSEEGGVTLETTDYEVHIPLDAPKIEIDDVVTVTDCIRNPKLIGQMYTVRSWEGSSVSVSQSMRVYKQDQRVMP